MIRRLRALEWALSAAWTGCFLSPLPDARTPTDRARELEPKCQDYAASAAEAASPEKVELVEPSTARVPGGPNGTEARLRGARIHLRPAGPTSREWLTRALECHQMAVTLGTAAMSDDDPYAIAGRWLSIDVLSERDGFVAVVESSEIEDARRILDRARRFGWRRRHSVASPASTPALDAGPAEPFAKGLALTDAGSGQP
jgi:hypothetical protein